MKKYQVLLLALSIAVLGIVLSGCMTTIQLPTPTPPAQWITLASTNTGWINCAGFWEVGDAVDQPFSISQSATVEITVWSDANDLPPDDFYVLLLSENQFQYFVNNMSDYSISDSLNCFDLTQEYGYYSNQSFPLPAGNYYLVFWNEYYQIGRGVYGEANYTIQAQY